MKASGKWLGLACLLLLGACREEGREIAILGGDAANGSLLMEQYECGTCHRIPGVRRAGGNVGPPLDKFARQVYIAGEIPNRPELLVRWIQDPQALVPETTMPDLGVNDTHARDMSAYLYQLR